MKYMLLIYGNQAEVPNYSPQEFQAVAQVWQSLTAEMKAAGVLVDTNGLAPVTEATSVRVRNGKTIIADGPFAETHEQERASFIRIGEAGGRLPLAGPSPADRWRHPT